MGLAVESSLGHLPLLVLECPLAVIVRTAPLRPPANRGGGGGLPTRRGNISWEDEDSDDAVSLLPAEEMPLPAMAPKESKFRVYQDIINKTSEALASPLPEDMASCFNATYHKASLAKTSKVKDLFSTTLRPANIDMVVRTTNNGLFSLKDPAMPRLGVICPPSCMMSCQTIVFMHSPSIPWQSNSWTK